MSKLTLFLLAIFVLALDQLTKHWAVRAIALDSSIVLIPKFLYLTRTTNTGSAFGLFPTATVILAVASLAAAVAIIVYVWRHKDGMPLLTALGLALPLGGALGNFLDRSRLGYVVDFVDVRFGSYPFPVFNVADSAICIGVLLLAINYLKTSNNVIVTEPSATPTK